MPAGHPVTLKNTRINCSMLDDNDHKWFSAVSTAAKNELFSLAELKMEAKVVRCWSLS